MTIVRIAPASRLLVLWVGGEVPEAARLAFESRGVAIEASVPDGLEEQAALSAVTAAFFIQSATKPLRILPMIAAHAPRLLNYDSRVFVLATPNGIGNVVRCLMRGRIPALWASRTGQDSEVFNGRRIVRLSIGGEQPLPHVRVHPHNVPMDTVANFVLRHPAGPAPVVEHAGLFTGPGTSALNPDTRLLLRRAFFDCANVHLQPLAVGYSGAGVFVAHASLQEGLLGARPLPFFVKIAERDRIAAEYDRYEERVDPYVPFHLRPHLVRERCCLGVRFGVLVGDFVEHSEGLVRGCPGLC